MDEHNITCGALFRVFSQLTLHGFGGVMPFAYRFLVERRQWLDAAEFGELLSVAQLLPGPTICNLAVIFGQRQAGVAGAAAALAGLLVGPFFIVIGLGLVYQQLAASPTFGHAMHGMAAAAAGLVLATAAKLARGMWRASEAQDRLPQRVVQLALVVASFIGLGVWKLGLVTVVAGLVPVGLLVFAWRRA